MKLILESESLEDYLSEIPPYIQFDTPLVQQCIQGIQSKASNQLERAQLAFEISRDQIHHSFDTKFQKVTVCAEDVLRNKEGICFAKAHLFATLCRGMGIPAGFCYQRVLRDGKTVESGYALHGLNAIYLKGKGWVRLDPRGNKVGVDAQFSVEKEKLAYPIRKELGEVDYPQVFTKPLDSVLQAMEDSKNTGELFFKRPQAV